MSEMYKTEQDYVKSLHYIIDVSTKILTRIFSLEISFTLCTLKNHNC